MLVAIGICGATLYQQQLSVFFRNLEPSCSIGIGTTAVTVQAWSANDDCQKMLLGQDNFTGQNWLKLGASPVSDTSGAIVCEMDMQGRHVIVRDGSMSNNGAAICAMMNGLPPI